MAWLNVYKREHIEITWFNKIVFLFVSLSFLYEKVDQWWVEGDILSTGLWGNVSLIIFVQGILNMAVVI